MVTGLLHPSPSGKPSHESSTLDAAKSDPKCYSKLFVMDLCADVAAKLEKLSVCYGPAIET